MQQQESVLPEPVTPNQDQEGHPRSKRARRALPTLQLSDLPEDLLRTALTSLCTPADLIVAGEVWPAQQQVRPETLAVLDPQPERALSASLLYINQFSPETLSPQQRRCALLLASCLAGSGMRHADWISTRSDEAPAHNSAPSKLVALGLLTTSHVDNVADAREEVARAVHR